MTIMERLVKRKVDLDNLETEIKQTLHCEKASYEGCGSNDDIIKGWIEALEYVLRQINNLEVK